MLNDAVHLLTEEKLQLCKTGPILALTYSQDSVIGHDPFANFHVLNKVEPSIVKTIGDLPAFYPLMRSKHDGIACVVLSQPSTYEMFANLVDQDG